MLISLVFFPFSSIPPFLTSALFNPRFLPVVVFSSSSSIGNFLSLWSQADSCCWQCGFYRIMQVLLGTLLVTSHIVVSIRAICLVCHGCKRERCLLCLCFVFFWHTSTVNAALMSCLACFLFLLLAQSRNGGLSIVRLACLSR